MAWTSPCPGSLAALPEGALRTELAAIDSAARKALQEYQPLEPSRIVPPLLEGSRPCAPRARRCRR